MPNLVDELHQAITDFVSQPENAVLKPGTGSYSTPFRGRLFGQLSADGVQKALAGQHPAAQSGAAGYTHGLPRPPPRPRLKTAAAYYILQLTTLWLTSVEYAARNRYANL